MISDIVLLEELPDVVKNSVEAYIGCLSGATLKHEYIGAIEAAGFEKIRIMEESSFSIDCMANDPTVKAIVQDLDIPLEEVGQAMQSTVSAKVCAVKPNGAA